MGRRRHRCQPAAAASASAGPLVSFSSAALRRADDLRASGAPPSSPASMITAAHEAGDPAGRRRTLLLFVFVSSPSPGTRRPSRFLPAAYSHQAVRFRHRPDRLQRAGTAQHSSVWTIVSPAPSANHQRRPSLLEMQPPETTMPPPLKDPSCRPRKRGRAADDGLSSSTRCAAFFLLPFFVSLHQSCRVKSRAQTSLGK